uniref:Uncharacterized protein n=1 Tax=Glossina palpalis gambiensis TaxID=67801 RepID=A0A1B0B4G0_9MUSC
MAGDSLEIYGSQEGHEKVWIGEERYRQFEYRVWDFQHQKDFRVKQKQLWRNTLKPLQKYKIYELNHRWRSVKFEKVSSVRKLLQNGCSLIHTTTTTTTTITTYVEEAKRNEARRHIKLTVNCHLSLIVAISHPTFCTQLFLGFWERCIPRQHYVKVYKISYDIISALTAVFVITDNFPPFLYKGYILISE